VTMSTYSATGHGTGLPEVVNYHVGQIEFNNCWGGGQARMYSRACKLGYAYYEYVEYEMSDSRSLSMVPPSGELLSIKVNVTKRGNAPGATVGVNTITADVSSGLVCDGVGGVSPGISYTINYGVAGKRKITQQAGSFNPLGTDAFTVGGVPQTSIPPGKMIGGINIYSPTPTSPSDFYLNPMYIVKMVGDCGIIRKGITTTSDNQGQTFFTILGAAP
jgi:hypothetical protein